MQLTTLDATISNKSSPLGMTGTGNKGIVRKPISAQAAKAQLETASEGIETDITRVVISRKANMATDKTANIDAGVKLSVPGRMISIIPAKPKPIAIQLPRLTLSRRKRAAPKVTSNGENWSIAEAELRGELTTAITKKSAANKSAKVLMMNGLFNISLVSRGIFFHLAIIMNQIKLNNPSMIRIWLTGKWAETSLITRSSIAKPAIASTMYRIPI